MPARPVVALFLAAAGACAFGVPARAGDAPPTAETSESWYAFSRARAEQLKKDNRLREAVEELIACGELRPNEVDCLAEGAVMMVEWGGSRPGGLRPGADAYSVAEALVSAAVPRPGGKGDPRLGYAIGRLRFADHDWSTAYQMFREARDQGWEPETIRLWYFRAVVNRAKLLLDAFRVDEAIAELDEVIAESPDHPEMLAARINLAGAHRKRDERQESERILRELCEQFPLSPQPWNTLGLVLFDQGRLEEALDAFTQSITLAVSQNAPFDEALVSKAHVLLKLRRFDESDKAVKEFLKLKQDAPGGLYLLAQLHRERGDTLEAVRVLRRAARHAPRDHGILTLLQQIHYERGEEEDAREIGRRLDALRDEMKRKLEGRDEAAPEDAAAPAEGSDAPTEGGAEPAPTDGDGGR